MVVENLSKEFRVLRHRSGLAGSLRSLVSREGKTVKAIDDVSFAIERGEFVGYVGPNGAGKSTTIKALAGILVPTSGKVEAVSYTHPSPRDKRQSRMPSSAC